MDAPIWKKAAGISVAAAVSWNPLTIGGCYIQFIGRKKTLNIFEFADYYGEQIRELCNGNFGNPVDNIVDSIKGVGEAGSIVVDTTVSGVKNVVFSPYTIIATSLWFYLILRKKRG